MNGFDKVTEKWFKEHPDNETTVMQCEKCGLFYKPSLGHKCEIRNICGNCAFAEPTMWGTRFTKAYVACTNEEHVKKYCRHEVSRKRQRTHPACRSFKPKGGVE